MSAEQSKDTKIIEKKAVSAPAKAEKDKALSIGDLDNVSGGINPQPLPPMPRVQQ